MLALALSGAVAVPAQSEEQDALGLFFSQSVPGQPSQGTVAENFRKRGYDFERFLLETFTGELLLGAKEEENVGVLSSLGFFLTQNRQIQFTADYASKFSEHLENDTEKYSQKGVLLRKILIDEIESHVTQ